METRIGDKDMSFDPLCGMETRIGDKDMSFDPSLGWRRASVTKT